MKILITIQNQKVKYLFLVAIFVSNTLWAQIVPITSSAVQVATAIESMPVANNSLATINYVRTWEPNMPFTDPIALPMLPATEAKQTTAYVDGLGRTIQTVAKQQSPLGKDVVSYNVFDAHGRETIQYLPYTSSSTDGYFKTNPFAEQKNFYNTDPQYVGEKVYYSKAMPEPAPLGRIEKTMPPGNAWAGNGRGTSQSFEINTLNDEARIWQIGDNITDIPSTSGTYPTGQLYKLVTTDEHGNKVVEYKDKAGKVILKKVQVSQAPALNHDGWMCTYYIYDIFSNLRCVIQPEGVKLLAVSSWQLTGTTLFAEQCFVYAYDHRNRMIIKKVPGAGEVQMVYDLRDRLVMTQDANMRNLQKWLITNYDELDRPIATGFINSPNNRAYFATLTIYPSITEELSRTWYDDYTYTGAKLFNSSSVNNLTAGNNAWPSTVQKAALAIGRVTGTKTKVLGNGVQYLISTIYYDDKGRVIQTHADNITGAVDITTNMYDYGGKLLCSYVQQNNAAATAIAQVNIRTRVHYDQGGRVTHTWKQLNGGVDKLIAQQTYYEGGQLKTKKLAPDYNGGAGLENLTYEYNIRGWLSAVNKQYVTAANTSNWFGFTLSYDNGFSKPQYNGNISGSKWRSRGDNEQRAFGYDYDAANRLLKGDFTQYTAGTFSQPAGINFNVKMGDGTDPNSAYDYNGNIKKMEQWGLKINNSEKIDNLVYEYQLNSNKLAKVTDQGTVASS
jgi:hypothetical protein